MQPKIEQARDQKVVYWRAIGEYGPHGEIGQSLAERLSVG
jgi:hypothetical protein